MLGSIHGLNAEEGLNICQNCHWDLPFVMSFSTATVIACHNYEISGQANLNREEIETLIDPSPPLQSYDTIRIGLLQGYGIIF